MGRTATELGETFGLNGAGMNRLLRDHGFLEGEPGKWYATDLGKQFAKAHDFDNGYGGYAYRQWGWLSWADGIVDALKASMAQHPDGLPSVVAPVLESPVAAVAAAADRQLFTRNRVAVAAAVGLAAGCAPMAKRAWDSKVKPAAARARARIAERRAERTTSPSAATPPSSTSQA